MSGILILDDDPDVALAARLALRKLGAVSVRHQPRELAAALDEMAPDVLLLDMNFAPGASDGAAGLALLREVMARRDAPTVVVMTAYAEVELAVQALKGGAVDFITKPWTNERLVACAQAALARRAPAPAAGELLGESAAMQSLRAQIAQVGVSEASVLILGENGVGKELVARALHRASRRATGPLLAVDMGSLPEALVESELFGHRRGSFTDARESRPGRFVAAAGGTLFLDEIGNLPLGSQAKLLAALERREVTPLGSDRPVAVDVRVLAATNAPEAELFDPRRFRPDLLYRLNTVVLRVPPLRERGAQDIALLLRHYLAQFARARPVELGADALARLCAYRWPGNVRELRQACERAMLLARGPVLGWEDFGLTTAVPNPPAEAGLDLAQREREAVQQALAQADGNISQAARLLGLSRAALYRRLDKHGL
ncbi:sigma-54-dependent transcriptional regulator [Roseateles saccharophilus]|uniref:DNA-binding NtrC family response regulator n=1 Tax=Roseateles saccharophilus TaxID=304 RepID=A0A4R3VBH0_ROSSA|nr:sigma-54 dependent transcriptional regulator [Roseateles saccharophilus]MDG0831706.1 sigma-54-dependent Fis family transcriptional regulator [Roseateles saccharophilus]TCV00879.1 DNA-binding NtrC family response regulator [Roseateles saccharophilus]